jgi:hypothetical protein
VNADTLADELDDIDAYEKHQVLLGKASEMLRQQAAEIESLKDKLMLAKQSLAIVEGWVKK